MVLSKRAAIEIDADISHDPARRDAATLETILGGSPILSAVLGQWRRIDLPDGWLVAGAVAQTVWNAAFGFAADHGLTDIDLVYFDGEDVSQEAEARHAARLQGLFAGLGVRLDVKNEARVHLWYHEAFGVPIPAYTSVAQAIATFPATATAIGVRPGAAGLEIAAPFGLADLLAPIVRPNKALIRRAVYEAKLARWRRFWPELAMLDWDDA